MAAAKDITFYDIAQRPPVEESCCAPNPWKARFCLNLKRLPYTTTWVPMLDIRRVRQDLAVAAVRKFADGGDFYTLPVIHDHATGTLAGDSFDIAVYLDSTYPSPGLFPAELPDFVHRPAVAFPTLLTLPGDDGGHPSYARFNLNVDTLFTTHAGLLASNMPIDPATAEEVMAEFARRSGVKSMSELAMKEEDRPAALAAFEAALTDLARLYGADAEGPFLLGAQVSYADFMVGAWLRMGSVAMRKDEWEQLRGWHGGILGRLHDALDAYAQIK